MISGITEKLKLTNIVGLCDFLLLIITLFLVNKLLSGIIGKLSEIIVIGNYRYGMFFRLSLSSNMIIGIFTDYRYGRLSLSEHVIIAIIVIENMKFYRIFDNIVR